jgi:NADH:ubiquinone oxidoreductase subunit K
MTPILFAAAVLLLLIALYGLLVTRNLIKIVIIIQILVKAAMLALVIAGKISGQVNLGQSLAVTVIVADTIVVVVGMALAIRAQSQFGTLDVDHIVNLES